MRYLGQVIAYGTFFGLVALLSIQPELRLLADEQAVVSLTFSHTGKRLGECRRLSQEEQMALPPNMRKPDECPRERHALSIRMLMDNKLLYSVHCLQLEFGRMASRRSTSGSRSQQDSTSLQCR